MKLNELIVVILLVLGVAAAPLAEVYGPAFFIILAGACAIALGFIEIARLREISGRADDKEDS